MNKTLIKLLQIYIVGDAGPIILGKWDRRIAMHPETGSFEEYLREQYRNAGHDSISDFPLSTYEEDVKRCPADPILHFNLAQACIVWCEELEKDYLKVLPERLQADPEYSIDEKEVMNGRATTFREYYFMRNTAVTCLNKIIEMETDLPLDITAYLLKVISDLYQVRDWEWSLKSRGAGLHFLLGGRYEQEGKTDAAIREYLKAIQLAPDHGSAHEQLGHIYKARGDFKDAETHYKEIIRYFPQFPSGHYFLGDLYQDWGKDDEAALEYEKITRLSPTQVDAHLKLGDIYTSQNKYDKAAREFSEVVSIDNKHAPAHFALALALEELGRNQESLVQWNSYLSVAPDENSEQPRKDQAREHIEFLKIILQVK